MLGPPTRRPYWHPFLKHSPSHSLHSSIRSRSFQPSEGRALAVSDFAFAKQARIAPARRCSSPYGSPSSPQSKSFHWGSIRFYFGCPFRERATAHAETPRTKVEYTNSI